MMTYILTFRLHLRVMHLRVIWQSASGASGCPCHSLPAEAVSESPCLPGSHSLKLTFNHDPMIKSNGYLQVEHQAATICQPQAASESKCLPGSYSESWLTGHLETQFQSYPTEFQSYPMI
jgi:hypothetical protein